MIRPCSACGRRISDRAEICPFCGKPSGIKGAGGAAPEPAPPAGAAATLPAAPGAPGSYWPSPPPWAGRPGAPPWAGHAIAATGSGLWALIFAVLSAPLPLFWPLSATLALRDYGRAAASGQRPRFLARLALSIDLLLLVVLVVFAQTAGNMEREHDAKAIGGVHYPPITELTHPKPGPLAEHPGLKGPPEFRCPEGTTSEEGEDSRGPYKLCLFVAEGSGERVGHGPMVRLERGGGHRIVEWKEFVHSEAHGWFFTYGGEPLRLTGHGLYSMGQATGDFYEYYPDGSVSEIDARSGSRIVDRRTFRPGEHFRARGEE